jgi:hypothetical protein
LPELLSNCGKESCAAVRSLLRQRPDPGPIGTRRADAKLCDAQIVQLSKQLVGQRLVIDLGGRQ